MSPNLMFCSVLRLIEIANEYYIAAVIRCLVKIGYVRVVDRHYAMKTGSGGEERMVSPRWLDDIFNKWIGKLNLSYKKSICIFGDMSLDQESEFSSEGIHKAGNRDDSRADVEAV